MALINLKAILSVAAKYQFGVGAFNAIDSHFVDGIFAAAEQQRSPVILNVAEVHLQHIDLEEIAAYVQHKAQRAALPVTLNLDHGLSLDTVKRAVACGFTSVMFDGSHLPFEANLQETQRVVNYCREFNVSVEAELGAVGGDEGGALSGAADEALYTDIEQAKAFVEETGADALAVAIGNSHGKYKGVPKLDFQRLETIAGSVDVPLVLHGGSGLSIADFQTAIRLGICKINFYTGMSQAAIHAIESDIADCELASKYDHYLLMMLNAQQGIQQSVENQMQIYASTDKANLYG